MDLFGCRLLCVPHWSNEQSCASDYCYLQIPSCLCPKILDGAFKQRFGSEDALWLYHRFENFSKLILNNIILIIYNTYNNNINITGSSIFHGALALIIPEDTKVYQTCRASQESFFFNIINFFDEDLAPGPATNISASNPLK